jgi:CRP/FNR family transcriptional regulator
MATARVIGIAPAREPRSAVASLRDDVVGDSTSPLQAALAQVNELNRALLLSQQRCAAAEEQIAILTSANADLKRVSLRRAFVDGGVSTASDALPGFALAGNLDSDEFSLLQRLPGKRERFRKHQRLYSAGAPVAALYAIHSGTCKTVFVGRGGEEQIAGYHIVGDIVGIDALGSSVHDCDAIALEDVEARRLPVDRLETFARFSDRVRSSLQRLQSVECSRSHLQSLMLGTMCADKRLANFLLDLSARYAARRLSPYEFALQMTRADIGSYLGVKLETVSRAFSRFHQQGLLQMQGRLVKLLDLATVRQIAERD